MFKPLPNTFVIGLGHKARHGKGTAAEVFLDYLGGAAREFAFADALKSYCRAVKGMTVKDAPLLQAVGTEFRDSNPGVWVRTLYHTIGEKAPRVAIISDVRYPDEVQMIKELGGIVIKCVRFQEDGKPFIDPSRPANHSSETALDNFNGWDGMLIADNLSQLQYLSHLMIEDICAKSLPDLYKGAIDDYSLALTNHRV